MLDIDTLLQRFGIEIKNIFLKFLYIPKKNILYFFSFLFFFKYFNIVILFIAKKINILFSINKICNHYTNEHIVYFSIDNIFNNLYYVR